MDEVQYERLMADFCAYVGIARWEDVVSTQHVEVEGKTVGLIPDPAEDGGLSVFIDLGPLFPHRDPHLYKEMLLANLEPRGRVSGAFCIYPDTGNAVYHLPLPAQVTGEALAGYLADLLDRIGPRFAELLKSTSERG